MTPRRRAILIVVLALLLIGLIIAAVLFLLRSRPQAAPTPVPTPTPAAVAPAPAPAPAAPNPLNPAVVAPSARTAAQQMAELFAERYGSYSNQGDFQNLRDLIPVMTSAYKARTEAYLATASPSDVANYQGVTSTKISTDVRAYDDSAGTAVIAVMLQEQKRVGASATPAISYRSLKMTLQKVGKDWRVDSAVWEN